MKLESNDLQQTSIEVLQLSMRAHASLKRSQISSIADLMNYTEEDLQILDPGTADEIIQALQQILGLTLAPTD